MRIVHAALILALFAAPAALAQTPPQPLFDGAALVRPPAAGSAQEAADRLAMRPTVSAERLARARADQPFSPWLAMQPVLGDNFTEANFPATARVFAALLPAFGLPINAAKEAYARRRPFLDMENVTQCDAPTEALAASGSFPSGHAAGGWVWGLVLAELVPSRADALIQRGRDYGDSRVICGFHYPTDVEAGRTIGTAALARLHADPEFRRLLDASRRELARAYR